MMHTKEYYGNAKKMERSQLGEGGKDLSDDI